ncbi:MAG: S-layer homology domain-containing protein [Clostridia bacterium]|nr:S-layer homology domain-containing protein [Clostridia bacterium]
MPKKIMCLILGIVLSCSCVITGMSADSRVLYENEEYIALFEAMDILPDSFVKSDETVSRSDFVTFLISLMNFSLTADADSTFDDVGDNTPLASALKIATSLGIVSVGDNFYPNETITYPQAVKMVIAALGYGAEATCRGGYPTGYMNMAHRLKMDVSYSEDNLTVGMAVNLLGQMCETYVNNASGVSITPEGSEMIMVQSDTFLYHYHNIYTVSGIVEASEVSYLADSSEALSPLTVRINGSDYVVSEGTECPLGYYAAAFVRETDSSDVIIYTSLTQNNVTVITSENEPRQNQNYLEYLTDAGTQKRIKCDDYYSVLYNGKAFEECKPSDFAITSGRIYAIDNNLDGDADVFSIRVPEYMAVDYVDTFSETIYDENFVNNLKLGANDVVYTSDTLLKNIRSGDAIEIFASKDGRYVELYVLKDKVSGILEGYTSDGKIVIDGTAYVATDYFLAYYSKLAGLGMEITAMIGDDNKIVSLKSYEGDMQYGYLDATAVGSGLSSKHQVRIFSGSGEVEILSLSDKLRINGDIKTKEDAYSFLNGSLGELIRYKKDAAGNLRAVNTPSAELGLYIPSDDGINALKRYNFKNYNTSEKISYKITGYFVPYFTIDSSTKIFCIAESEKDVSYRFSLGNGTHFLPNDSRVESNSILAFNVDETGRADAIVYKTDSYSSALDEESASALVSNFNAALDDEGVEGYKIELYSNDRFETYYIDGSSNLVSSGAASFTVGDFVRYKVNSLGYITNISKLYDNNTKTLLGSTTDNTKDHYYYGDIYLVGDNSIALMRDGGDIIYLPISLGDIGYVSETGVSTMPKNVIKTFKHIGNGCSKALVKCYYSAPQAVYIYEE